MSRAPYSATLVSVCASSNGFELLPPEDVVTFTLPLLLNTVLPRRLSESVPALRFDAFKEEEDVK